MSYGIKKGSGSFSPIEITRENAISRGRYISNIEYRKTDTAEWVQISIVDKDARTARRSYFPPKMGVGFTNSQEQFDKEMGKLNGIMANLAKTFLGDDYETGEVNTFEEFVKKVISDIGNKYYKKELRIKLVYDSKNRPSLPSYGRVFEDPITVPDNMTKLMINVRDRVEQVIVKMDDDGLDISKEKKVEDEDDLPFA
jgi:hypothetical protein